MTTESSSSGGSGRDPRRMARAEKVRRIFERFDANGDGGLDRSEMAALVVAVNPRVKFSSDQISAILDEVFRTYSDFVLPGPAGLSLPGLLRTYDDGAGDVDRDFDALSFSPPAADVGAAAADDPSSSAAAAASAIVPSGSASAAATGVAYVIDSINLLNTL